MDLQRQYPNLFRSSGFLKQPVIEVIGERHAVLKEDYDCGQWIIPAGFEFDGATMPTWVWSIIQLDPFGRIGAAALPHDFLYVTLGIVWAKDGAVVQYPESIADEMFYHRAQYCQLNWLQCRLVRRAVIWFGDYDYDQTSQVFQWNKDYLTKYISGEMTHENLENSCCRN